VWCIKKLFLIAVVLVSSLVAAQSKKTVTDYWKLFGYAANKDLINVVIDQKNDYISFEDRGTDGGGEFAVWRRKNGTDLIGYTVRGCGPECVTAELSFRESNKTDVTKKVLPTITAAQDKQMLTYYIKKTGDKVDGISYYLAFPRVGTTIRVVKGYMGDEVLLAQYKFNGSSFVFEMAK
jgi:hypothetical protein